MSNHFPMNALKVAKKKPPADLLDYQYEWTPKKVKTFIEDEGVVVFVKKGSLSVSSEGAAKAVKVGAGELLTFAGTGQVTFEFHEKTVLCHEAELLYDEA